MEIQYLGFDQRQNSRVYRFEVRRAGRQTKQVSVTAEIAVFRNHSVGIQEGPFLSRNKLTADLERGWEGEHELTAADVRAYAEAKALTDAQRPLVVLENHPNLPLANPKPPKPHTEIHIDPKFLDNYIGRYQLMPNLILEITRDGDRLFAQDISAPKFEVFAEGEKNFYSMVGHQIAFKTGPDGRATSLILHRAGCPGMPAARLP